jgi:hypothetical protein
MDHLTFPLSDIMAFCTQIASAGPQTTTSASVRKTGNIVIVVGLFFQLALLVFFVTKTIAFHKDNVWKPSLLSNHPYTPHLKRHI